MKIIQSQTNNLAEWQYKELGELLDYEQPTNYIVDSEDYRDYYPTPVLTAGKTFILGHTDENFGVYQKLPVIIFDDFTTAHKFVDFPFKVKSSAMKILKAKKNVNIKFIYGWMQSHPYIVGEHKRNYLSEYQYQDLLLPSFSEQNRIVSVLETWDKAIEKLSKKIEVKKQIKKGLIQDLLTGKKRLKGFNNKWESGILSDIFSIKKGSGLSKEKLNATGQISCILYGELYTTYNEVIYSIKSRTSIDEGTSSKSGDILIPASTTTGAIDLAVAACLNQSGVLLGGDINILRPKDRLDSRFFAYYLTHTKKHTLARLAQGVTIVHLYASAFKNINIEIPKLEEQKKIADIITMSEKEIIELKKKLLIIKEQKRYLLNNLITGKIRTPETLSTKLIK